ncbi:LAMI_0E02520g1_1 [Lachancea mirantina]|uniref:Non-structural maintenance of chromosomes element 4 n=1 Tax=Lachancea mirantina TaxID=1230905 RepID=A0A1G4JJ60_9SACH|nr:LAMI_0E02520g1_1 [Lachancea mirantina]
MSDHSRASNKRRRLPDGSFEDSETAREIGKEEMSFELLKSYRDLTAEVVKNRVELARDGDIGLALNRIGDINMLFDKITNVDSNKTPLLAQDARLALGISQLAELGAQKLKIDDSGKSLSVEDFINSAKRYMLRDHDVVATAESQEEDQETGHQESGDVPFSELQKLRAREEGRKYLQQFAQYQNFFQFDWFKMGTLFQVTSKAAVTTDHMLGPFGVEKRPRNVAQRQQRDVVGRASQAKKLSEMASDDQGQSTLHQTVRCFDVLRTRKGFESVNLFEFVLHPTSFGKSVENLFYTGFLIKDGKIVLEEGADGFPTIRLKEMLPRDQMEIERQRRNDAKHNHLIFQLDHATWRKLVQELNIQQPFIADD